VLAACSTLGPGKEVAEQRSRIGLRHEAQGVELGVRPSVVAVNGCQRIQNNVGSELRTAAADDFARDGLVLLARETTGGRCEKATKKLLGAQQRDSDGVVIFLGFVIFRQDRLQPDDWRGPVGSVIGVVFGLAAE
jgi:hypothetical protein